MKNADLKIILGLSKLVKPDILPHLLGIYKLGYQEGVISQLKSRMMEVQNEK